MTRKIAATMVSQHPDHAGKPYWHDQEFIHTQYEAHECFLSFSELGASEYKWDWEGKFVDESIIERLFSEHFDYFKKFPLGREKFLTFRLPNPKVETEFRLGRAFMGILGAAGLAKEIGAHTPPLFEVILPMTESAEEMIAIQEAFKEMTSLKHRLYNFENGDLKHIEIIPLFEQVDVIISSVHILEKYLQLHQAQFGFMPNYIRPYLARSDPALNSGLVPTVLAIKIALSRYAEFTKKTGVLLYPIIGSASLPFRGGLTPETVTDFCLEYRGIKTALLQSSFRYDHDKTKVLEAIKIIENTLPTGQAALIPPAEEKNLIEDGMIALTVSGKGISIAKAEGIIFAFDDTCTHAQCSLSEGVLEERVVECPCHGSRFNIESGDVLSLPATLPINTYPTKVEDGWVWVEI